MISEGSAGGGRDGAGDEGGGEEATEEGGTEDEGTEAGGAEVEGADGEGVDANTGGPAAAAGGMLNRSIILSFCGGFVIRGSKDREEGREDPRPRRGSAGGLDGRREGPDSGVDNDSDEKAPDGDGKGDSLAGRSLVNSLATISGFMTGSKIANPLLTAIQPCLTMTCTWSQS